MTAVMDAELRRSIMSHIGAACDRRGIYLAQNVVQNLVTKRLQEVANEMVTGKRAPYVNWDDMVWRAYQKQEEGRQKMAQLSVDARPLNRD